MNILLKINRLRGMSAIEIAIVVAVIGALIAIATPLYLNSRNEANDTQAREELESAANQASSMLVRARYGSYLAYEGPTTLSTEMSVEDPSLTMIPLGDGFEDADGVTPDPTEIKYINDYVDDTGDYQAIGVGISSDGTMTLARMSKSGRCWLIQHNPDRDVNSEGQITGMQFAEGDPNACGWTGNWQDDPDTAALNQAPVASDGTQLIPYETLTSFDLDNFASDPDGDPLSYTILPSSEIQIGANAGKGTLTLVPATGAVTFDPANGVSSESFELDFEASDGPLTDTARVTLEIGPPPAVGGLAVAITCTYGGIAYNNPANMPPYNRKIECTATPVPATISAFDWNIPGAEPFDCTDSPTCSFTRADSGDLLATVTVRDSSGAEALDNETITFIAVDPTVTLTCDNNVSYVDTAVCTATAYDENSDPITFVWTSDDSGVANGNSITSPACVNNATCMLTVDGPTSPNAIDVDITVVDNPPATVTSGSSSDATTVEFINAPPSSPRIVCEDPVPHTTNITCTVSGAVDPEGAAITYNWSMASDNAAGLGDTPSPAACAATSTCTFTHANPQDTITITAVASDPQGASSSDSVTTSFYNTPPEIGSVVCESPKEYATENTNCVVTVVADPEGDSFTRSWAHQGATPWERAPAPLPAGACGDVGSCTFTRSIPESVTTEVTVTDQWGDTATRPGTAVFINNPPAVIVTCDRTTTNKAGVPLVTCIATETSGDPGPLTYDWTGSHNNLGMDACNTAVCTVSPAGPTGTFTPHVELTDPYGSTGDDTGPGITIVDAAPTVTLSGCSVPTNTWCTLTAKVSDPDDATASVNWPAAGAVAATSSRQNCTDPANVTANGIASVTCQYRSTSVSTNTITITATAGSTSRTASATARFTNRAPTINNASCSVQNGQVCSPTISWTDPEGEGLTFTWPSFNPSVGTMLNKTSGACNGFDAASTTACGYRWTYVPRSGFYSPTALTVTACDPHGSCDTAQITARWTAVPNSDTPAVSLTCTDGSTTWSTSKTVAYNTNVTCTVTATDADGISHYWWNVGGTPTTCNNGGGGADDTTCKLVSNGTTATVAVSARDLYCGVRYCGTTDGSIVGTSGTVTIIWSRPPAVPPPASSPSCNISLQTDYRAVTNALSRWFASVIFNKYSWTTSCYGSAKQVRFRPLSVAQTGGGSMTINPGDISIDYSVNNGDALVDTLGFGVSTGNYRVSALKSCDTTVAIKNISYGYFTGSSRSYTVTDYTPYFTVYKLNSCTVHYPPTPHL